MTTPIKSYRDITDKVSNLSKEDEALIKKAYEFARAAHWGQRRYSGEPFFNHLFETALILAELGMRPRTIAAGFLHDIVEDTSVTREDIEQEFGSEVLFLVEGVTKLGEIKYRGTKRHVESLRKLLVATSKDIRVLIIKLADRLHNMRTLEYVPEEKRHRIAIETLDVYAPIAHRLGIGQLKGELEDLSFKYLYPKEYEETRAIAQERYSKAKEELVKIHTRLVQELARENIYNVRTDYRRKHLWSLYKKLQRKDMDIDQVYDVMALRIIVDTVSDCYRVLGIIHSIWKPLPGRIKDYVADPKPNGYKSIHTTIFTGDGSIAEIQIRTKRMHIEAEHGIASHVHYKNADDKRQSETWLRRLVPSRFRDQENSNESGELTEEDIPKWISEMAEAQKEFSSPQLLSHFKKDFLADRIFTFTPKGDVIDLPQGSSPVDFAYYVHSGIGNRMAGAKVNGKLVSLNTKLKEGDIVEIMTSAKARPTAKWLEYSRTLIAKRRIRQALNQDH